MELDSKVTGVFSARPSEELDDPGAVLHAGVGNHKLMRILLLSSLPSLFYLFIYTTLIFVNSFVWNVVTPLQCLQALYTTIKKSRHLLERGMKTER